MRAALGWISNQVPFGTGLIEFIPISMLAATAVSLFFFVVAAFDDQATAQNQPLTPHQNWQNQGSPAVLSSKYSSPPPPSPGKGATKKLLTKTLPPPNSTSTGNNTGSNTGSTQGSKKRTISNSPPVSAPPVAPLITPDQIRENSNSSLRDAL